MRIDHINRDKLDNRIENLRLATAAQNSHNSRQAGGNSKYKGVYKAGWAENKWFAKMTFGGKQMYFGTHSTEEDAARAINKAYLEYHGEYANLNEFEKEIKNA